jgi:hypothetical protein
MSGTRSVSIQIHWEGTRCICTVTSRMCPVRPMPPILASNRSVFSDGLASTISSLASRIRRLDTCWPKQPSRWWFLPCTSLATMPPSVTNFVPGVTGVNQPRGRNVRFMSARLSPASADSTPVASSKLRMRFAKRVLTTLSPGAAGKDESPYERPRPRDNAAPRVSASMFSPASSRPGSGTRPQPLSTGVGVAFTTPLAARCGTICTTLGS